MNWLERTARRVCASYIGGLSLSCPVHRAVRKAQRRRRKAVSSQMPPGAASDPAGSALFPG